MLHLTIELSILSVLMIYLNKMQAQFLTFIGHVVASLDKAIYDDYLCLVVSNKQQIKW